MGEDNITHLTAKQKDTIYKEMLKPLKVKISQILLYDTKAASQFLQVYNQIIENEEQDVNRFMGAITQLEIDIGLYQKSIGKEKVFEERSKVILQIIEDLMSNSIELSIEEFETKFTKLKSDYEEGRENYSFEDRDIIEQKIYELQAYLIMRLVESRKPFDLQQTISEQDKDGIYIFVLEKINKFRQKDGMEEIATQISNIVMTDNNAVLNSELWNLMNIAERGGKSESKQQLQVAQPTTSTAMTIVDKKKRNRFVNWFSRLFSQSPILPLQISDLSKISIEWLSQYVPKSMLLKLENDRLSEENMHIDDKYKPDPRTIIYEMLKERKNIRRNLDYYGEKKQYYVEEKQVDFYNENGGKIKVKIKQDIWFTDTGVRRRRTTVGMKAGDSIEVKETEDAPKLIDALIYAKLLDQIFNMDLEQKLLQEIRDIYINRTQPLGNRPIYDGLSYSLDKMSKEFDKTNLDFEATEEANRKQFYEKNKFKKQLKQIDVVGEESTQKIETQKQKVSVKEKSER